MIINKMIDKLVCPQCKKHLIKECNTLICKECNLQWQTRENIPNFSNGDILHSDGHIINKLQYFLDSPQTEKCSEVLYNINQERIANSEPVFEDQRMADWCYLLPHSRKNNALILGCGLGIIPISLAQFYETVYAIDPVWEKVAFLDQRKRHTGINNLFCIQGNMVNNLPFPHNFFDLIAMSDFMWCIGQSTLSETVRHAYKLLRPGGTTYLCLGNRYSLLNLFDKLKQGNAKSFRSIWGYKRILRENGFSNIRFYASLPFYDGISLFYLPLENDNILQYFFRSIFPLLDMVSPETKKDYAMQYTMAKLGARLALFFRLTWLTKFFVSGFSIFAEKDT